MVEQWKEAGIRAKINVLPSAKYLGSVGQGAVRLHRHGPIVRWASWCWRSPTGPACRGTSRHYSNKQFDELLTKAEGHARRRRRGPRSSASSRRSCRRTARSCSPCGGRSSSFYDKKVKGFQRIRPAISSAKRSAWSPDGKLPPPATPPHIGEGSWGTPPRDCGRRIASPYCRHSTWEKPGKPDL